MPSPESRIGYSQQQSNKEGWTKFYKDSKIPANPAYVNPELQRGNIEALFKQNKLNSGIQFRQEKDLFDKAVDVGKRLNYVTMGGGVVLFAVTGAPIFAELLILDGLGAVGLNHIEQQRKKSKGLAQAA